MHHPTYPLDQAAPLLNLGRNTLARRLRDVGVLGPDNLPAGPYRGRVALVIVATGTYWHPICGWTHYGRTEFTDAGLDHIARKLGIDLARLPHPSSRRAQQAPQPARSLS
ncbi:hypothetical protein [Halomonas saccharevitans]|uniref:Antirepressor protein C-terminal domain-containing protein n=1 Tax=Halomonas saccharevitans TaxID=416872 RepID=A0A1I7CAI3_9GAMM|nr:hypothetical protein [Halomonas saccharevitans]SFT96413.1 hypothetical protein SAMN04487956_13929 [Halomonas saccharevitans]